MINTSEHGELANLEIRVCYLGPQGGQASGRKLRCFPLALRKIREEADQKNAALKLAEQRRRLHAQEKRAAHEAARRERARVLLVHEMEVKQAAIAARRTFMSHLMAHQRDFVKAGKETLSAKRRAQRYNIMRNWHSKYVTTPRPAPPCAPPLPDHQGRCLGVRVRLLESIMAPATPDA